MAGENPPTNEALQETGRSPNGSGTPGQNGYRYPWMLQNPLTTEVTRGASQQILHYEGAGDNEYVYLGEMFNIPDDFDRFTKWFGDKANIENDVFDNTFEGILHAKDGGRLSVQGKSIYDLDEHERTGKWTIVHELEDKIELPDLVAGKKSIGEPGNEYHVVGVEVPLPLERTDTLNEKTGLDKYENRGEDPFEVAHDFKVARDLLEEAHDHDLKVAYDLLEEVRSQSKDTDRGLPKETKIDDAIELRTPRKKLKDADSDVNGAETQRPVPQQKAEEISMSFFSLSRLPQENKGFLGKIQDRVSKRVDYSNKYGVGRHLRITRLRAKDNLKRTAESLNPRRRKLAKNLGSLSLPGVSLPRLPNVQNAWSRIGEYFTDEQKGRRRQRFTALGLTTVMAAGVAVSTSDHGADKLPVEGGATVEAANVKLPIQPIAEALRRLGTIPVNISAVKLSAHRTVVKEGQYPWIISERQLKLRGNPHPTKTQTANYDQRLIKRNGITPYEAHYIQPGTELELPPG